MPPTKWQRSPPGRRRRPLRRPLPGSGRLPGLQAMAPRVPQADPGAGPGLQPGRMENPGSSRPKSWLPRGSVPLGRPPRPESPHQATRRSPEPASSHRMEGSPLRRALARLPGSPRRTAERGLAGSQAEYRDPMVAIDGSCDTGRTVRHGGGADPGSAPPFRVLRRRFSRTER